MDPAGTAYRQRFHIPHYNLPAVAISLNLEEMALDPILDAFRYDPLDVSTNDCIRLIRVNPQSREGLLDCELWHECIMPDKFDIITYNHDLDTRKHRERVCVNGRLLKVGPMVWNFLVVARVKYPGRQFWIDGLCIDAESAHEKAYHVNRRSKILLSASRVYAWLGSNDSYASHALDTISRSTWDSRVVTSEQNDDAITFWIGMCEIMLDSHWRHAETMQEVVFANELLALRGEREISMVRLQLRAEQMTNALARETSTFSCDARDIFRKLLESSGLPTLWNLRDDFQKHFKNAGCPSVNESFISRPADLSARMLDACMQRPCANCTDIRTRVHSMLIAIKSERILKPSTSLNPLELFLECIPWACELEGCNSRLEFLARSLDMNPVTILLYSSELDDNFRIPGLTTMGIASDANRTIHQRSSGSDEQRKHWEDIGYTVSVSATDRYHSRGLEELQWINGAAGSHKFNMPEQCQRIIAMRYANDDVFLILGIHLQDGSDLFLPQDLCGGPKGFPCQRLSDQEFTSQSSRCCAASGIYRSSDEKAKAKIYFAIIDGSVFNNEEIEASAIEFQRSAQPDFASSMKWMKPTTIEESTTPAFEAASPRRVQSNSSAILAPSDLSVVSFAKWKSYIELKKEQSSIEKVVFSPDGNLLASCAQDNAIHLWDTTNWSVTRTLQGSLHTSKDITFSAVGNFLAHGSGRSNVQIWHIDTRRELRTLIGLPQWGMLTSINLSPNGKFVATSNIRQTKIRLWPLEGGESPKVLEDNGHFAGVTALAFSPDGTLLASGSVDKTLLVWELAEHKVKHKIMGHTATIVAVAFSPDGRLLASASPDKTIRLWGVETAQTLHVLRGHEDAVSSICFSPDNSQVLSGSDDSTLRIWDCESGKTICKLTGHRNAVKTAVFSPCGDMIVSGSDDQTIRIWGVKTIEQPSYLDHLNTNPQEWAMRILNLFKRTSHAKEHHEARDASRADSIVDGENGYELHDLAKVSGRKTSEPATQRPAFSYRED